MDATLEEGLENNKNEMDSPEGAYENINHHDNEGLIVEPEDKGLPEENTTFETTDSSPYQEKNASNGNQFEMTPSDGAYEDVVVKTMKLDDDMYSYVGFGATVSKDANDGGDTGTQGDIQPSKMAQSRVVLYLAIALSVVAFLIAVASMVITIEKDAISLSGPTRGDDQLYIQELKWQIGQLTKTLNTTVQRLNDLKNEIRDARSAAKSAARQHQILENFTSAELQKQKNAIFNLTLQVNNVTTIPTVTGPRGFNGSQGASGPPGPKGAVNFSQCQHRVAVSGGTSPGRAAVADVAVPEPKGKKIVGATCSTNFAAEYVFSERVHGGIQMYSCDCRGQAAHLSPVGPSMHCYLHYWECPTT